MYRGPLLVVLAEFEDDLAAKDACGMLGCVDRVLSQNVPVAPVTMAEGIVFEVGGFLQTIVAAEAPLWCDIRGEEYV